MEKSQMVSRYELVVIVDARLSAEIKESVRKGVADAISKQGGKVINSQVWLEKHKLTFQIKKCGEGTYFVFNLEGDSGLVEKVKAGLKLNEKILRFMFIKVEPKMAAETAKA